MSGIYALRMKNMIAAITRTISRTVPIKPKPIAASICLSSLVVELHLPGPRSVKRVIPQVWWPSGWVSPREEVVI